MKPITIHPPSVIAGLALAALAFLATGAQITSPPRTVFVGGVPAQWWTYVQLSSDGLSGPPSYVVPTSHRFVITRSSTAASVTVNGAGAVNRLQAVVSDVGQNSRVVLEPGDVVATTSTLLLWGYLEPL